MLIAKYGYIKHLIYIKKVLLNRFDNNIFLFWVLNLIWKYFSILLSKNKKYLIPLQYFIHVQRLYNQKEVVCMFKVSPIKLYESGKINLLEPQKAVIFNVQKDSENEF